MKFVSRLNDLLHTSSKKEIKNMENCSKSQSDKNLGSKKNQLSENNARKLRPTRSIYFQFLVLIIACSTIPIITSNVINYENSKMILEKNSMLNLENIADQKVEKIKSIFNYLKVNLLAADYYYNIKLNFPTLVKFDNDKSNSAYIQAKNTLDNQLANFTRVNYLINNVILADKQGNVFYLSNDSDYPDMNTYKHILNKLTPDNLKDNVFVSEPFFDTEHGDQEILMVSPYMYDNQFVAWVAFDIPLNYFAFSNINNNEWGNTGEIDIANKFNDNITYLNNPRYDSGLVSGMTLSDTVHFSAMLNALNGQNGVGLTKDYRNVDVITAWRYIPEINVGLVAKMDVSE